MAHEYRKVKNISELTIGFYFWKINIENQDERPMVLEILKDTTHTPTGWWAGPILKPEQWGKAEKFAHACMHVQTNLQSIGALSQALADEVLIVQEMIKQKNEEQFKDFTEEFNTLGVTTGRTSCDEPNESAIAKGSLLCGKCKKEIKMNEPSLEVQEGNQTVLWCMKCVEKTGATVLVEPETTV